MARDICYFIVSVWDRVCNWGSLIHCGLFVFVLFFNNIGTPSGCSPLQHAEGLRQLSQSIFQEGKIPPSTWSL